MRCGLALLLVACAAHKPAAPEGLFAGGRRIARVPRPSIDVPALPPHDTELDRADLIWPLRQDPELEPHANLATFYRVESWRSLCEARRDPRGVNADEAAAYLSAWCELRRDDLSIVRQQLAALAKATSAAIAKGAHEDLIAIVALDHWLPARSALDWMQRANLAGQWQDELSAAYFAIGRAAEARVVAKEYARGAAWVGGLDCRSLVRVRELLHEPWVRDVIEERKEKEPVCARLADTLDQIDVIRRCPLFATDPLTGAPCTEAGCKALDNALASCGDAAATWPARLAYAYRHWPSFEGRAWAWVEYAKYVGSELPEARVLASAALENAALVGDCGAIVPAIRELAQRLGDAPGPRYLQQLDHRICEARRSPTLDHPQ